MDQDFKNYLDGQFGELRQDMSRRLSDVEGQVAKLRDEVHQTRVLVEKLDDKIDLVAEGVQSNTEVVHRLHEENRQELREFRDVMEGAHRHLEGRTSGHDVELERLDRRVTTLETRGTA